MADKTRTAGRWPLAGKFKGLIHSLGFASYREAAEACGLPQPTLSNYLRGKTQPSPETLDKVLSRLGATRADLLAARSLGPDVGLSSSGRGAGRTVAPPADLAARLITLFAAKGVRAWGPVARAAGVRPDTMARYLTGQAVPPASVLDAVLAAIGADRETLRATRPRRGTVLPEEE